MKEGTARLRRLVKNPLIVKDGLSRVRSWRAPVVILLYLALLGLFAFLSISLSVAAGHRGWGYAQVGNSVYVTLALVQLVLVCLFAPGVAAGAISGERERQTLDVLVVTCMTPFGIVWGKLVASVAFILLLVTAALPIFATVFLFGGIDFEQFLVSQLLIGTTALTLGAVSLFLSTLFRRTLISTVASYGLAFAGTAGVWVVGTILTQIAYGHSQTFLAGRPPDPHPLLWINPLQAMATLLQSPSGARLPLGRALQLLTLSPGLPASGGGPTVEPWQATALAQLLLVVLCVVGAVLLLRGRRHLGLTRPATAERQPVGPEPSS